MSLYNMLFGVNPAGGVILATLGLSSADVPRFRDCYVSKIGNEYRIVIHTRTGGGNRDYYENRGTCEESYPEYFGEGKEEPSGPWNDDLRASPHYDRDMDDDFDSTYADFYFRLPAEYEAELKALADRQEFIAPSEKWQMLLDSLKTPAA